MITYYFETNINCTQLSCTLRHVGGKSTLIISWMVNRALWVSGLYSLLACLITIVKRPFKPNQLSKMSLISAYFSLVGCRSFV